MYYFKQKGLFYYGKINPYFFNFIDWIFCLQGFFCSVCLIVIANVIRAIVFFFFSFFLCSEVGLLLMFIE